MTAMAALNDRSGENHAGVPNRLRNRLKQATAEAHHRLDTRFESFDLSRRDGYRRFLQASAAALLPLEAALEEAGVADAFADWRRRSRRAAVLADLALIGGVVNPLTAIRLIDRNAMLGVMYVLEGSRLGAKFLLKTIDRATDPVMAAARAYLGHGSGQHFWRSFLAVIENESVTPDEEAAAIDGARLAFAMFAEAAARA